MTYSLLISDLHLDPARPEHLAALETLLDNHAGKADRLYVSGDLFEAWISNWMLLLQDVKPPKREQSETRFENLKRKVRKK